MQSVLLVFNSSTPRRTCCEVRVMLCMTRYICAPLQSAGGFILEGDWTPTKTKLSQLTTYRGGIPISFQDKHMNNCSYVYLTTFQEKCQYKLHKRC